MRGIMVQEMGAVGPGMYIAHVDSDDYPLYSIVPSADYDVDEQDWQHIVKRKGHVDIATYVLEGYDCIPHIASNVQSTATVWVLVEQVDGEWLPIEQDPNDE